MSRGEELAAQLALGARELAEHVFEDAAKHIHAVMLFGGEVLVREGVDQAAEGVRGELAAGVGLRQHTFETRVLAFDRIHRRIHARADVGLLRCVAQVIPAVGSSHPA